jgi:hypothetical protein
MSLTVRLAVAAGAFIAIYAASMALGGVLYATGWIGDGPLHTECEGFRQTIADELGVKEKDVEQSQIKERAIACHEGERATVSKEDAFRDEFRFFPLWPSAVVALMIVFWPWWAAMLHRQELADPHMGVPAHEH